MVAAQRMADDETSCRSFRLALPSGNMDVDDPQRILLGTTAKRGTRPFWLGNPRNGFGTNAGTLIGQNSGCPTTDANLQDSDSKMMVGFQRLDTVFRDATDPILIEDLAGVVLDLNDEAIRTYGFAREDLIGQPIKMIVPEDCHGQADDLLRRCRAGELVRDIEGVRVTKEGHEIPVLLSLSLLHDDSGKACAIATFAKDISRLKSAEDKLRQLTRVYRDAADPILLEDLNGIVFALIST